MEFSNADGSPLNASIFEDFQDNMVNSFQLRIKSLPETDVAKKGSYALQVSVSLPSHPANAAMSSPFQVTIAEACDAPTIQAPDFTGPITYVLTDNMIALDIPFFMASPS